MSRRFLDFPDGAQGWALLLLRLSSAVLLVVVADGVPPGVSAATAGLLALIAGLTIGCRTREVAAICVAVAGSRLVAWPEVSRLLIGTHMLDAGALVLLGPGSLSLDARLYGRRCVAVRPARPKR